MVKSHRLILVRCTSCGRKYPTRYGTAPGECIICVAKSPKCQWFLDCHNDSIGRVEHPTIGDVEICQEHYDWVDEDDPPNPTKFIPPLVAKHGRKLRATFARMEDD